MEIGTDVSIRCVNVRYCVYLTVYGGGEGTKQRLRVTHLSHGSNGSSPV